MSGVSQTMLSVYNSLARKKVLFQPHNAPRVNFYLCGVTVYDDCHIGHARTNVAFDTIVRYLRYRGYEVCYVRNITDIDDKIIQRAHENQEPFDTLVDRMIQRMHQDFDQLNLLRPDIEPRATQSMDQMIHMIQTLIDQGYAYQVNGDVYYSVAAFPEYGKLSNQNLQALKAGHRVDSAADKQSSLDFALWKSAKPGEPSWPSPWGQGRPGWHIECSAMSKQHLGCSFDIHAGGSDLMFPHHENEIAQSEAANGCPFAHYWLHSGMVQIDDTKMSKSLNNFFTIQSVLTNYHPEVVRYFLVSGHYRSALNYNQVHLDNAKQAVDRLYTAIEGLDLANATLPEAPQYHDAFIKAMDNDFNTPEALSVLFSLVKVINQQRDQGQIKQAARYGKQLCQLAAVLGLLSHQPADYFAALYGTTLSVATIEQKIQQRQAAKQAKDFATADAIRDELKAQGITLQDHPTQPTTWKKG